MTALGDLLAIEPETQPLGNLRPHCVKCGRFVPLASIRTLRHWESPYEFDQTGTCRTHGGVDVTWEKS